MKISIHQPNFLPWVPYFEKIKAADIFVLLNHAQFQKGGYLNRFNVGGDWHTLSTNRGLTLINTKKYVNYEEDWKKILQKFPCLDVFNDLIGEDLVTTNTGIIKRICQEIGIETKIVEDYPTELTGTVRLIDICKRYGGDEYLYGPSGAKYMDLEAMEKEGIKPTPFLARNAVHFLNQ